MILIFLISFLETQKIDSAQSKYTDFPQNIINLFKISVVWKRLDSFLNLAGTKAAGAYGDRFYRAVLNDLNFLDIGILDLLSPVVRVAYIVTEHRFFAAYFTFA